MKRPRRFGSVKAMPTGDQLKAEFSKCTWYTQLDTVHTEDKHNDFLPFLGNPCNITANVRQKK